MTEDIYAKNRALWDEWASFHLDSDMYRGFVEALRQGGDALLPLERDELGSVEGLKALHLQCHVGTDTLSLARRGAAATGVDFSRVANDKARGLGEELGIEAEFVHAELSALPSEFDASFDLVFASYGVVYWLPDLDEWAATIRRCLRPGGRFYLVDGHPITFAIADAPNLAAGEFTMCYPYLRQSEPVCFDAAASYANGDRTTEHRSTVEWAHGLAEIVMAVIDVGLELEFVREHAAGYASIVPGMVRRDGHWFLPGEMADKFPLTFSLSAHRPLA